MEKESFRTYRRRRRQRKDPGPYRVLVPLTSLSEAAALLPAVQAMVEANRGEAVIVYLLAGPQPGGGNEPVVKEAQLALNDLVGGLQLNGQVQSLVRPITEGWPGLWKIVQRMGIDLLVLSWPGDGCLAAAGQLESESAARHELVVIRSQEGPGPDSERPILAAGRPFRGQLKKPEPDTDFAADTRMKLGVESRGGEARSQENRR